MMNQFKPYEQWTELKKELINVDPLFEFGEANYNGNGNVELILKTNHSIIHLRTYELKFDINRTLKDHFKKPVKFVIKQENLNIKLDEIFDDKEQEKTLEDLTTKSMRPQFSIDTFGNTIYHRYRSNSGALVVDPVIIAPFNAIIDQKTIITGPEQTTYYLIRGMAWGKRKFSLKVNAETFNDAKQFSTAILNHLPGEPPDTDPRYQKLWSVSIAHLTRKGGNMKELKAYNQTGWTPKGDFTMPGGGVGDSICYPSPALRDDLANFKIKPLEKEKLKITLDNLLDLANVYNSGEFYVSLAHALLPPLIRWIGNDGRYLLHIHADTGSLKTELGKILMSLYGPTGPDAITYRWTDTPIGIYPRAYALKDCLLFLDDLKPGTIKAADNHKWVSFLQSAVDSLSRRRASISGGAGQSYRPHAIILSTGEAIPQAGEASYMARMILLKMSKKFDERNHRFDKIKKYSPNFNGILFNYVLWLKKNGDSFPEKLRALQNNRLTVNHPRLAVNFAANLLSMKSFINFCLDKDLICSHCANKILTDHLETLTKAILYTNHIVIDERYSKQFITAVVDSLASGFSSISKVLTPNRIGFEDETKIYLLPGAKEIIDKYLLESGKQPINITKRDLYRQAYEDEYTFCTESSIKAGRFDCQMKDPATNRRTLTMAVFKNKLEVEE